MCTACSVSHMTERVHTGWLVCVLRRVVRVVLCCVVCCFRVCVCDVVSGRARLLRIRQDNAQLQK